MGNKISSMRFIIIILFIVLMISTFAIIGYVVFSSWKTSIEDVVVKMKNDIYQDILNHIDEFITVSMRINEANHDLIENRIVDMNDKKEREKFFSGVIKSSSNEVYSFSYGTKDGEYYGARRNQNNDIEIMENNSETKGRTRYYSITSSMTAGELVAETERFDPRTRDWYKIAEEKQKPAFSSTYKHFVMDDLAISVAYPIYNENGVLEGVLGTHIILSKINAYLKQHVMDKEVTAYIIERGSGNLIANSLEKPNFETTVAGEIKRVNIEEVGSQPILEAYQEYKKDLSRNLLVKTKDDKIHVDFCDYNKEGLDWLIVIAIPESQFTAEIIDSIHISILLSAVALILAILIYIKSTEMILNPVYNLISTTEKFSNGDLSERAKIFRNDEIGKLSHAFNRMAEQLYALINTLEEKVKERTLELEKTNSALKKSEADIRLLLDSTAEAIYGVDINGNCTFCNASCIRILKYNNQNDLIGKNIHNIIHHKRLDGTPIPSEECEVINSFLKGEEKHVEGEILWRADGTSFLAEYFSYPQYRDEKIIGAVVTFMDISERKKSEKEILYLSYHDQLTGLYNRRYFEEELKRLDVERNYPLTIIMADMNGLKLINDSLGHAMGDELLKKVADVLKKGCRPDDVIARLGGDEFVVILPKTEAYEVEQIIKGIKELALKERVGTIDISISFGYGIKSRKEESVQETLKKAEDHMYKNKLFESPSMRGKTINAIICTLNEKSKREEIHYKRVSELCKSMGQALGLPEGDIEELKNVGLLHDIGKIAMEESMLSKSGKLEPEEWEELKRHPEIGYRILSTVNDMSEMAEYVLAHHERWDGKGYPKGLRGMQIPLQSRIIAIADAYDAITGERGYRSPLSNKEAVEELQKNAGVQFDPELIKIFIEKVLKNRMDVN